GVRPPEIIGCPLRAVKRVHRGPRRPGVGAAADNPGADRNSFDDDVGLTCSENTRGRMDEYRRCANDPTASQAIDRAEARSSDAFAYCPGTATAVRIKGEEPRDIDVSRCVRRDGVSLIKPRATGRGDIIDGGPGHSAVGAAPHKPMVGPVW